MRMENGEARGPDAADAARPTAPEQRLVVQHPSLSRQAVGAFAQRLGRAPAVQNPVLAEWAGVDVAPDELARMAEALQVDAALVPQAARLSDYRLLAFDMDSTLITIECVDEMAAYAGRQAEVAAITEAAMRGEITDYDESLRRRLALLAGLDVAVLARVFDERLRLSPGALPLLEAARRLGLKTLLVSGGFTYFTGRLQADLALDYTRSNSLEIVDGKLTGRVLGPIVNARMKAQALLETCSTIGCDPMQAIAIGDGANDLEMMAIAGVSVAYHAKPVVRARTTYAVNHCGLDAVLNLLQPS